jgi:DNA-binding NarL/FixJ family response regulator
MNRNQELLVGRRIHISNRLDVLVAAGWKIDPAVKQISQELFISERTVYDDLKRFNDSK